MKALSAELERTGAEYRQVAENMPDEHWESGRSGRTRTTRWVVAAAAFAVLLLAVPLVLSRSGSGNDLGPGSSPAPSTAPDAAHDVTSTTVGSTTTTSIFQATAPDRTGDPVFDPADRGAWQPWAQQVTAIESGVASWSDQPDGVRGKLADVAVQVPEIAQAHVLAYRATEWFEDAFYLLGDGSDTMVYIGWNELESTDPISSDAWRRIEASGADPIEIVLPTIDEDMSQGTSDDLLVLDRITDRVVDFVADTAPVVATVRFFQLSDTYGSVPITLRTDPMARVANAVFTALDLPKDDPGELAPPPDVWVPPVDALALRASVAEGTTVPQVVACAPDQPPVHGRNLDDSAEELPLGALARFLDGHASGAEYLPLPRADYIETHMPDGSIVYVYPFEPDPTQAVAWISVVETPTGWTVDTWKSAGC